MLTRGVSLHPLPSPLLFYRGMGERIRLRVGRIRGRMTLEECEVAVVVDGVGGELKFVS